MALPKVLTESGYNIGTLFYRGVDRRPVASGATLYWSIKIPATNENTLLSRDLKSYEGGSILYQVYVRGTTSVVGGLFWIAYPTASRRRGRIPAGSIIHAGERGLI